VLVSAAYNEAQDPGGSCDLDAIFAKLPEVVRPPVLAGLQGYSAEINYFSKNFQMIRNPAKIFPNQSNHGR
jgi:hypothetical protein